GPHARPAVALSAPAPGPHPGLVRALRADGARAQPTGRPARSRGGRPAPARQSSPGPAPLLSGRNLALGGDLLPAHGGPPRGGGCRGRRAGGLGGARPPARAGGGRGGCVGPVVPVRPAPVRPRPAVRPRLMAGPSPRLTIGFCARPGSPGPGGRRGRARVTG